MSGDSSFTRTVRAPVACPAEDIASFRALVVAGGEVSQKTLPALIPRALALAFVWSGTTLVGVGGLKRPYATHRAKVFKGAGAELVPEDYPFELGWVHLHASAQGRRLTTPLVQDLVRASNGAPIYATSRVDNSRMHSSLLHSGFRAVGGPYASDLHAPSIQLFVSS